MKGMPSGMTPVKGNRKVGTQVKINNPGQSGKIITSPFKRKTINNAINQFNKYNLRGK